MKGPTARAAAILVAIGVWCGPLASEPALEPPSPPAPEPPRAVDRTERVEARLVQLDVTVTGPRDLVMGLSKQDFEVWVDRKPVEEFIVDRLCQVPEERARSAPAPPGPRGEATAPAPPIARATYLFYFEQGALTMGGRQAALDMARELVRTLVRDGSRAMIVSNATELRTVSPLTDRPELLLASLDDLEHDRQQWDSYAELETQRLGKVQEALGRDMREAIGLARSFQAEERWRQEKALRRLAMVLGRFAEIDPPKVVFYFADTMRANAGEHYLSFFGPTVLASAGRGLAEAMRTDAFSGQLPLDRVVHEAAAQGVRFYTVEARGMTAPGVGVEGRGSPTSLSNPATPGLATVRIRDAQNTLTSLALETGGRAFLNGVPGSKVARQVLEDLGCLYLVSFDPAGFPEDRPLPVQVRLRKSKLKAQLRGVIVIQSPSSRLTARLLSAFSAPETVRNEFPLRAGVIPTGFEGGRFRARVQVAVPGTGLPGSSWDLGVSVVTSGEVGANASGHISVSHPGVPVVLERDLTFGPGPFELVAVARESRSDQIASRRIESGWPDPDASLASIGPIAIVQRAVGAFLRNGQAKESGPLLQDEDDPLRADVETAFIGIVCRSRDQRGPLEVDRRLVGEVEAPFEKMIVDLGSDRCAIFQDRVVPGSMAEGSFRYAVRVFDRGQEVARAERSFFVAGSARAAAGAGGS
jgi:VWFA-related protein